MEEGSNGALFRIRDVYLWDKASLFHTSSFEGDAAKEEGEEEEEGPAFVVEESVQMRALGLPTRFSSATPKTASRRPRRRHRIKSSLHDRFSQKLCAGVDQSLIQSSLPLPESPFDSIQVRAVQLDRGNSPNAPDSEASHCAGENTVASSSDHQESNVSISDNHLETLLLGCGAIDGCGVLALNVRVQADVSTIDELGTVLDSTGWLAYERAGILDGGGSNGEKEAIWPDVVNVTTGHCLELDCKTMVSPDDTKHRADETIMASSRIHQDRSSFLELTSIEGACVSIVDHHGARNEEASLLSCGVIDGASSCGSVALEAIDELGTVLNNKRPLANERARISKNGDLKEEGICRITPSKDGPSVEATLRVSSDGALVITEEAVAISSTRVAAQDEQITTLSISNQKVVAEASIASCDARANNVLVKVTEQECFSKDPQIQIPQVLRWSACWDDHYGRYYFYNKETLESTWEPPKGFESYAYTSAAEDNNEAFQGGPVNGVSNSDELVAKEDKEERVSSEDGSKSDTLLHGPLEVEALLTVSVVKEALSSGNHLESLQSNLADRTDDNLPLKKVTAEGPEVTCESSFCQVITNSASRSSVVQVDAATLKVSRRAKMSASCLVRLENQGMDIAAAMGDHSPTILKYWAQRFRLFSKYDSGVKLDEEGWFSVTPEAIAKHQAARCQSGVIVDAFTGVGGNAIQFALADHYVVAIDNDPKKIEYARHNAMIYGVADRIDFILGDFFTVSSSMQADVVFLSPPWGGPDYLGVKVYDILTMLQPKDGVSLFKVAHAVALNIIFFLPRNVNMNQLAELSKTMSSPCSCEVERNYLNGKLKAITAYYGQFASMEETCN